jgi:hypothetical protein
VPDVASFGGWLLLASRRRDAAALDLALPARLWHRDNVLVLIGLLLVGATLALKVTGRRRPNAAVLPADGRDRDPAGDPVSTLRSRRS